MIASRLRRRSRRRAVGDGGLTLVEVMIAVALAGIVFASAWPWCWNVTAATTASEHRGQAMSSLAYALRVLGADVRRSRHLAGAPAAGCTATSLSLDLGDAASGGVEQVTYRYDPQRGVIWRKAPGTYLVEQVTACRFSYFDAVGNEVPVAAGATLGAADSDRVVRIRLEVSVRLGSTVVTRACDVSMRPSGRL
jgi:prepilin-type N-terminal cleavage/methylation domain-containing protein